MHTARFSLISIPHSAWFCLCSCFSLMLAIVWVLEVEVSAISSVIPSLALSPGKLWAASRSSCSSSDPSALLSVSRWTERSILMWPNGCITRSSFPLTFVLSKRKGQKQVEETEKKKVPPPKHDSLIHLNFWDLTDRNLKYLWCNFNTFSYCCTHVFYLLHQHAWILTPTQD